MATHYFDIRGSLRNRVPEYIDPRWKVRVPKGSAFGVQSFLRYQLLPAAKAITSGDDAYGILAVPDHELWEPLEITLNPDMNVDTDWTEMFLAEFPDKATWDESSQKWIIDPADMFAGSSNLLIISEVLEMLGVQVVRVRWGAFTDQARLRRRLFFAGTRLVCHFKMAFSGAGTLDTVYFGFHVRRYPLPAKMAERLKAGQVSKADIITNLLVQDMTAG